MAVRFSGSGQEFSRALSLGTVTAHTVCAWVYLSVDRGTYSSAWSLDAGQSDVDVLQTGTDGTTWGFYGGSTQAIVNATVGVWYFIGIVRTGTGGTAYVKPQGGAWSTVTLSGQTGSTNMATLRLGTSPWGEWMNGRLAAWKFWNGVNLTQAEIEAEAATYDAVKTGVHAAYFRPDVALTTDYSGNGRTLSGGTGTTVEAGPAELDTAETGSGTRSLPASAGLTLAAASHRSGTITLPASAGLALAAARHSDGTVSLPASAGLELGGARHAVGTVTMPATASLEDSGTHAGSSTSALPATADLTFSGVREGVGTMELPATAGLTLTGTPAEPGTSVLSLEATAGLALAAQTHRAGTLTLPALAGLVFAGVSARAGSTTLPAVASLSLTEQDEQLTEGPLAYTAEVDHVTYSATALVPEHTAEVGA